MTFWLFLWLCFFMGTTAFYVMSEAPARRRVHVHPYRQWRIIVRKLYDWQAEGWA